MSAFLGSFIKITKIVKTGKDHWFRISGYSKARVLKSLGE